jgi:hypothetical protein
VIKIGRDALGEARANCVFREGRRESDACLSHASAGASRTNSGERLSASLTAPPNKKAPGGEDQTGQSGADAGTGNGNAIERKRRVKRSLVSNVGADPQPIGVNTSTTFISCPALKIGGAEGKAVPGGTIGLAAESQKSPHSIIRLAGRRSSDPQANRTAW